MPSPSAAVGTATVVDDEIDRLRVDVDSASVAILVLTDPYSRDWTAEAVDARGNRTPLTVMPADYVLRAVAVGPGPQQIEFNYRPRHLAVGGLVSAVAWTIYLVVLLIRRRT